MKEGTGTEWGGQSRLIYKQMTEGLSAVVFHSGYRHSKGSNRTYLREQRLGVQLQLYTPFPALRNGVLLSPQASRRPHGSLPAPKECLKEGCRGTIHKGFQWTGQGGMALNRKKVWLDQILGNFFFIVRVLRHCNRLLREVVVVPSLVQSQVECRCDHWSSGRCPSP